MGNYVTTAVLQSRLGTTLAAQLTTETGATPDADALELFIGEGEGICDSYFAAAGHDTPLDVATYTTIVGFVRANVLDLAVWRAHLRRPPVPEDVLGAATMAEKRLAGLAKGTPKLPADTPLPAFGGGGTLGDYVAPDMIFGRENLANL